MDLKVDKILLSGEIDEEDCDIRNYNRDAIVLLDNGDKYVASFFTFQYIEQWRMENLNAGEYLNGKYFWAPAMVLIDDCSRNSIEAVIRHFVEEGEFVLVFKKL